MLRTAQNTLNSSEGKILYQILDVCHFSIRPFLPASIEKFLHIIQILLDIPFPKGYIDDKGYFLMGIKYTTGKLKKFLSKKEKPQQ